MTMNNIPNYIVIVGFCLVLIGLSLALYAVYAISAVAAILLGGIYLIGFGLFLVFFGLNS